MSSSLALKELLGSISLEPIIDKGNCTIETRIMKNNTIERQIASIEDEKTKMICSLLNSSLENLRNETRERLKIIEDRINNLSHIIVKRTNLSDLEKAITKFI